MNNLSNEQLKQIIENDHVQCGDAYSMARELLAYREAAQYPVGFINGAREPVLYGEHIGLAIATHLYAAPQLPAVPDVLPCDVRLEPGLRLGKGVRTQVLIDALIRREKYHAELDAMTPEQRAEMDKIM